MSTNIFRRVQVQHSKNPEDHRISAAESMARSRGRWPKVPTLPVLAKSQRTPASA
ncbi:hypothetical protein BDR03DRAFT_961389 [Suillus americanus]|nr:hypothetical protein BDR03DRAFT_961389 [Suillus americanus]